MPGVNYPAQVREEVAILPGGRALRPFGRLLMTGTGLFAVAVSPSGKTIVTANIGISTAIGVSRPSITVVNPGKPGVAWNLADFSAESRQDSTKPSRTQPWQGLTTGLAVTSDGTAWVSEGDSGRVVELNLSTGGRKSAISLTGDRSGSFTDALVHDAARNLLMVLDQANSRAAIIDLKRPPSVNFVKTGALPVALALSEDGKRLYVASAGSSPGSSSLSIIDVSNPVAAVVTAVVQLTGAAPQGIATHDDLVYISQAHDDAIAIVNGSTAKVEGEIPLRIPGLDSYRGIMPLGLAFEPKSGRLLVAESGINAVGVIDPSSRKVMGHLPVGWFPDSIAVRDGQVYVGAARGVGTGPSAPAHRIRMFGGGKPLSFETDTSVLRRGSVSIFTVPADSDLAEHTEDVMQANGLVRVNLPKEKPAPPVRYVVMILKGDRSFDEILGDVSRAGDKMVNAEPTFARFGLDGYVPGNRKLFSLHANVTPNHHQIATRWSFSDNYYADSDYAPVGYRWLTGACPDLWSESEVLYHEAGNRTPDRPVADDPLWGHLKRHNIEFRNLAVATQMGDEERADQFIGAVRKDYLEAGKPLPRLLLVSLPNDTLGARPDDAHPYEASYIADNDYALGRIIEFLSGTPWWKEMAVFVSETGAEGGADHVDSHRTLLLAGGPWFRNGYVSHSNSSAPALLRTIFKLLDIPPLNLYDATAADLTDMFGAVPDFAPYAVEPEDSRLLDTGKLK